MKIWNKEIVDSPSGYYARIIPVKGESKLLVT